MTAGIGSVWLRADVDPAGDFYSWTGDVPQEPGQLLRSKPYEGKSPEGAEALRILYSTTRTDGSAAVASAVAVVPTSPVAGQRPVLAWQHGTTGVSQACAPSLTDAAVVDENIPGISELVARG